MTSAPFTSPFASGVPVVTSLTSAPVPFAHGDEAANAGRAMSADEERRARRTKNFRMAGHFPHILPLARSDGRQSFIFA
jgi:hypothetical protein